MSRPAPTTEEVEDILLSARYGELDEIKDFVNKYGEGPLETARDERGNTVLHMCCGNGHLDVLKHLIPLVPNSLLQQTNEAGSPPIHWAVANNHVTCVQALVELPEEQGGGLPLLKSIFAGEGKEEVSGWIEGYLYRVEGGDDEDDRAPDSEVKAMEGDDMVKAEAEAVDELAEQTEEVKL
ncbi:hypothetical protein IAU60_005048 [Kwoniella sp. DSM 27419]